MNKIFKYFTKQELILWLNSTILTLIFFKDTFFMFLLTLIITIIFYFILKYINTTNLIPSTISVTTSFFALYLTFRSSTYFALAYALNDMVLIYL